MMDLDQRLKDFLQGLPVAHADPADVRARGKALRWRRRATGVVAGVAVAAVVTLGVGAVIADRPARIEVVTPPSTTPTPRATPDPEALTVTWPAKLPADFPRQHLGFAPPLYHPSTEGRICGLIVLPRAGTETGPRMKSGPAPDPTALRGGHFLGNGVGHDLYLYRPGDARVRLDQVRDAATACDQWDTTDADGNQVTWAIEVLDPPPVGDASLDIAISDATGQHSGRYRYLMWTEGDVLSVVTFSEREPLAQSWVNELVTKADAAARTAAGTNREATR